MDQLPTKPVQRSVNPATQRCWDAAYKFTTQDLARKLHLPLLIIGETGTGKDAIAQSCHIWHVKANERERALAARPGRPETPPAEHFRAVNCAALPDALFESELFGYTRGAFTGANTDKAGLATEVGAGVLFLDEIGDLSPENQTKLLRFLQAREIRPVGGSKPLPFLGRVVAATHRDLHTLSIAGVFREDLYHRLATGTIRTTPLRQRPEDVGIILQSLIKEYNVPVAPSLAALLEGPHTDDTLTLYATLVQHMTGNVRQLQATLFRAAINADGAAIHYGNILAALLSS